MILTFILLLPLLVATPLAALLGTRAGKRAAASASAAVAATALLLLLSQASLPWSGQPVVVEVPWIPSLGLDWQLRLDALSLFFAFLILAMGLLIILYARYYLADTDPPGKFFATLMLFMSAMLGIVLADNLLLLAVFWELTSLSSFLLIGYWSHTPAARRGARQALLVTGVGGIALAAGALLLGVIGGTLQISQILPRAAEIAAHPAFDLALSLLLIGALTKSAQFPFHFWLPDAMAAPTPVSAYLHSATMVKAGLFLTLRLHPLFTANDLFLTLTPAIGLITMLLGAIIAIFKHDLKGLLAYSTVSHLGLILALIGIATPLALTAALLHLFNHALFKAPLFMAAGIVDHAVGSRDLRQIGGVGRFLPVTATFATLAALAMAGVPPLNGFLSKELFFTTLLETLHPFWLIGALGAATASVVYSTRFIHDTFFNASSTPSSSAHLHEPPWGMRLPVILLALLCLLFGVAPHLLGPFLARIAAAVTGFPFPHPHLALWHGLTPPLLLSAVVLLGGTLLYALLIRRLHSLEIEAFFGRRSARHLFARLIGFLVAASRAFTRRSAPPSLTVTIALTLLTAFFLGLFAVDLPQLSPASSAASHAATPLALILWAATVGSALLLLLFHRHRLAAILIAGVIGLSSAVAYALLSAPDLAMTQIAVEVVTTLLLFLALSYLPQRTPLPSPPQRWVAAAFSLAAGIATALLTYWLLLTPRQSISHYFLAQSLPAGGGANIVNVILVDFRGYDTMGEITVLGIAALGGWALLANWYASARQPFPLPLVESRPMLLRQAVPLVLPLSLVVSIYIFLRGHNLPGGGFIAGLITAAALLLLYLAHGLAAANTLLHAHDGWRFARTIAAGLGVAVLTGIGAMLLGYPFLTSAHGEPHLPLIGTLPLASAALFDLGVYLTVVGATLLLLTALAAGKRNDALSFRGME